MKITKCLICGKNVNREGPNTWQYWGEGCVHDKCHKKSQVKPTKKQLKVIKKWWGILMQMESDFYANVAIAESSMQQEAKMYDLEFFLTPDSGYKGVGNESRTMRLLQDKELTDGEEK